MNRSFYVILILLAFTNCKKEKIPDEYSYLFGKWYWTHTFEYHIDEVLGVVGKNIMPSDLGQNYSFEMSNKCITFFENDKVVAKRRFKNIAVNLGENDTSAISIGISLTKKDEFFMYYYPNRNYIYVEGFPYDFISTKEIGVIQGGKYHKNIFVR